MIGRNSSGGVSNYAGLPWALDRLREACKLNLIVSCMDLEPDVARAPTRAAQGLRKLNILVLSSAVWP